jgi:acetyl coenzyme A synthetase (ADP forming)-like protein
MNSLNHFFFPNGIVLIGASHDPAKLGYILAYNLTHCGYKGNVHFVNPKGGSLFGRQIYTKIAEVPDPVVDLAVLLLPAALVPDSLSECGERGIPAAIISSGGFRETGAEGAKLEEDCLAVAKQYGMRLIGPNCVGLIGTHQPLNTTFLPHKHFPQGEIAFISQSGAICDIAIDWALSQGFGLSWLVSLGNQADVSENEILDPIAADPDTHVIAMYLEGVRDGRQFVARASQAIRQKPVVVLKVGKYSSGRRAATSHTGALVGQENAYEAAFRKAGVIRAETTEQLFDWARALAWCPAMDGPSIAVLTNAGGLGVIASDAVEGFGLKMAALAQETQEKLCEILPPAASINNPIDMLGTATSDQYARCLQVLVDDPGVNAILVIIPPPPVGTAKGIVQAMLPTLRLAHKPTVVALIGDRSIRPAVKPLNKAHIPVYHHPEKAVSALAALVKFNQIRSRPKPKITLYKDLDHDKVKEILSAYSLKDGTPNTWLPQNVFNEILTAYGIPTPPSRIVNSPQEAVAIGERFGSSGSNEGIALKVVSTDILHKSDIGGVLLNLKDPQSIETGFEKIIHNTRSALPNAHIQGVLVQPVIPPGQEVILGAVQDTQFGPLIMFGSGGIEVEGLKDIAFALAPLDNHDIEFLLENTWAGRKLSGYRSLPPADRSGVMEILTRLGDLVSDFPEIKEIEINPLRVLDEGKGVYALDGRARI